MKKLLNKNVSRRSLMKSAVIIGGGAFLGDQLGWVCNKAVAAVENQNTYPLKSAESIIYSVCLQCHTACPIKCKIQDGLLAKLTEIHIRRKTCCPTYR